MEVHVQHKHVAMITTGKPDGGWYFASDNGGVSAWWESRNEEKSGGSLEKHRGFWSWWFAVIISWPSLRLALRVLLLLLALGVTLGHGVDNGADKEAYHDDHNLLKEPRQPALLLPGTAEKNRERERRGAGSVSWGPPPPTPPPPLLHLHPPHPTPLHPTPCSPLCSWCCRLGGDPAPCAGQIEIRGNKTRGSPHRPPS